MTADDCAILRVLEQSAIARALMAIVERLAAGVADSRVVAFVRDRARQQSGLGVAQRIHYASVFIFTMVLTHAMLVTRIPEQSAPAVPRAAFVLIAGAAALAALGSRHLAAAWETRRNRRA